MLIMKIAIKDNLVNPQKLEKLYQENKTAFKREFNIIYPEVKDNLAAQAWHERLNFESEEISWGTKGELMFVVIASVIAGILAKIPAMYAIREDLFYQRNIAFIVIPLLAGYFLWKQKIQTKKLLIILLAFVVSVFYINLLPDNNSSDTLILACIHLPLFLWTILGFAFVGGDLKNYQRRLDFLRYNGDLIVMTTIILIAGAIMTGVTLTLFSVIGLSIEDFYLQYIVVWGLVASPIVGTYLVLANPQLVNKVSPVIAKVFTPLVLVTLLVYLFSVISMAKDPFNDREFLLIFNLLLIGVMAIIHFSIAESAKNFANKLELFFLLGLSATTVAVNGIALSAILFRIVEWGFTPNRLAVLGSNILILLNLLVVTFGLINVIRNNHKTAEVEKSIVAFLPIFSLWTVLLVFLFPVIFNFE